MAELDRYSPAQALARGLICCAVTGDSNPWARFLAFRFDCPPEQVFVVGVDIVKRLAPTIDLDDIQRTISKLIATPYQGDTFRPLRQFGEILGASIAYVDRNTIAAHLERPLPTTELATGNDQFGAPAFDDHVGERGPFPTDWIETLLTPAGIPGHVDAADSRAAAGGAQRTTNSTNLGQAASRSDHGCAAQPSSEIGW